MLTSKLTDAERALWKARLLQAEQAKHDLMTGVLLEQFIDQNGEQVRYTKANTKGLDKYIAEIKAMLDPVFAGAMRRQAIGFIF